MRQPPKLPDGDRQARRLVRGSPQLPDGDQNAAPWVKSGLKLPETQVRAVSAEVIRGLHDDYSPATRPMGFLSVARNFYRSGKTAASTRPGRTSFGSVTGSVNGLGAYYDNFGTEYLVAGAGGRIYASSSGSWTQVGSVDNGKMNTAMFNDKMLFAYGGVVMEWAGTLSLGSVTPLPGNSPSAKYILSAYNRVWLAGVPNQPHLVYVSDIADAEVWPDTFDVQGHPVRSDARPLPINDRDGDQVTWLLQYRQNILVFKRYSVWEIYGPEAGQRADMWRSIVACNRGTPNGRTIQEIDTVLYWLSDDGVVAWGGGKQEVISDPTVRNTMKRVNWAAIDNATAGRDEAGRYLLSVPVDGATNPNLTLVYETREGSWWVWDGWTPTAYARFHGNGAEAVYFGTSTGAIYSVGGTTDSGTAIGYEAVFGPTTGGINTRDKIMLRAYFVVSVTSGTLNAAVSPSDTAAFGSSVVLAAGANTQRLKKYLPLNVAGETTTFAPRFRLSGTGQVTIHDVGLEWTERES